MSLGVIRASETMRVHSWKDFRRALRGMQRNLRKYCREEMEVVEERIYDDAIRNIKERFKSGTGLMERSLTLVVSPIGGTAIQFAFYGTHYMEYQEYGFTHTSGKWVEGKHFMKDAYDWHEPDIDEALNRAVIRSIKSHG